MARQWTLRQLEHFVAAAEEQHFTRAARRVNIVQSGLSASIRSLEDELKTKLFFRHTRQVELTAAGQVLFEKAKIILAALRDAQLRRLRAVSGLQRGVLAIGTVQRPQRLLSIFRPCSGNSTRSIRPSRSETLPSSTTVLMDKLQDGRMDLALLRVIRTGRKAS